MRFKSGILFSSLLMAIQLFLIVISASSLQAQTDSTKVPVFEQTTNRQTTDSLRRVDTLRYLPPSDLLNLPPIDDSISSESRLTQNPTTALLRSMVVPGWGQIVNKAYIKAGIFGGLQLYFASRSIHHAREAAEKRRDWKSATVISEKNAYYDEYLVSSDARNAHRWYFGIATLVSMFDAYVDAHLSGRPRRIASQPTSLGSALLLDIEPTPNVTGLQLAVRF